MTQFVYRMNALRGGSDKYGPCEVCGKHADTTYLLTELMPYFSEAKKAPGLTAYGCVDKFGHKSCLSQQTVLRMNSNA